LNRLHVKGEKRYQTSTKPKDNKKMKPD